MHSVFDGPMYVLKIIRIKDIRTGETSNGTNTLEGKRRKNELYAKTVRLGMNERIKTQKFCLSLPVFQMTVSNNIWAINNHE